MITQSFDLNLIPESSPVVVHCDQYDKGTGRLVISLYDENIAYSPSGTAKIQGVKPDGKGFEYDASISGNVVTANLTEQMSAVAGRVRCQIVVTETTGRTGTFVFILDVQPSALPLDTDISESDYQFIEQALEDCAQAVIDSQDNAEDAEAWAVGERSGVPVTSGDPTYNNNAEYWAGQAAIYAQGGWHYMGSIPFADLPTTGMVGGDMYNITDDFVTDSRFIEGSGKQCYAGQNVAWVASVSKWDLPAVPHIVPDMTSSTKGIGRPDGKTTEVSSGVFNAIGVSIPAEVNTGATQYASNWLYYEGTTEVITPSTKQNYRVVENGTAKLYYWTGSAYAVLSGGGGGGTGDYVGLYGATEITSSGSNLNSYTTIGTYYRTDTSFNVTNYPINATDKFLLVVQRATSNSNTIVQSYLGEAGFAQRSSTNSGSTWNSWNSTSDTFYSKGIGAIYSGHDLNNMTNLTSYRKTGTDYTPSNAPAEMVATDKFLLYNLRISFRFTLPEEPTLQLIYSIGSDGATKMYVRSRVSSYDPWSAWKKFGDESNITKVTTLSVAITGWTSDTTSQSGTTLYKKQISLNHVYVESPTVDIGSSGVLPTVAEQESYNLLQYVTVDNSVPCLYLYASTIPTTAFYIKVKGVD